MNAAKLPPEFTKKAPRRLSELQAREEGAIGIHGHARRGGGPLLRES